MGRQFVVFAALLAVLLVVDFTPNCQGASVYTVKNKKFGLLIYIVIAGDNDISNDDGNNASNDNSDNNDSNDNGNDHSNTDNDNDNNDNNVINDNSNYGDNNGNNDNGNNDDNNASNDNSDNNNSNDNGNDHSNTDNGNDNNDNNVINDNSNDGDNNGNNDNGNDDDNNANNDNSDNNDSNDNGNDHSDTGNDNDDDNNASNDNSNDNNDSNADSSHETHGLSQSQRDQVIEIHNRLRKGEHAADMYKLRYNKDLERLAQEWADTCAWGHRDHGSFKPNDYGFKTVGENIWANSDHSMNIPKYPIQEWFNEKSSYDYDNVKCNQEPCGHYTAVTWGSTTDVGCGIAKCPTLAPTHINNAIYFVCNYGPGGNAQEKKPYKKGDSCSACGTGKFFCTDGLCDASCTSAGSAGTCECKANCVHGNRTSDCTCQCDAGYSGVSCSEKCVDKNLKCGVNGGWPSNFCDKNFYNGVMYDQVSSECPKMCGLCKTSKRRGKELELLQALKRS